MIKYLKKNRFESIGIIIFLIVLYFSYNYFNGIFNSLYNNSKTTECHEIYGYFGSYVGGVLGTIIGFVTLFFVYITYTSQRKELKLQRELIAQQQFESTFFNMLNVHRELKNSLRIIRNPSKIGIEVFNSIKSDYEQIFHSDKANNILKFENISTFESIEISNKVKELKSIEDKIKELKKSFTEKYPDGKISFFNNSSGGYDVLKLTSEESNKLLKFEKERIGITYKLLFDKHKNQISHYCRNVYHILKYIRENEKNKTLGDDFNKYKSYANIFQSQLNVDEQFLLFYNFIHFNENDNVEYLHPINIVNHYKFLENLGSNNLLDKELHNNKNFYTFDIK